MKVKNLWELNKKLQWQDFHDSSLISLSFQFCDKQNFLYNSSIVMEIITSFKDNPEKPIIIKCLFKEVKNVEFNAIMDYVDFSDLGTIYSLVEDCGKVELISVNGWKLKFSSSGTDVKME